MIYKAIPTFLVLILFTTSLLVGQTSKKMAEHIALVECVTKLKIELPQNKVDLRSTKGSRILVETNVSLSLSNEHLLGYLIETGRYNLKTTVDNTNHTMTLSVNTKLNGV